MTSKTQLWIQSIFLATSKYKTFYFRHGSPSISLFLEPELVPIAIFFWLCLHCQRRLRHQIQVWLCHWSQLISFFASSCQFFLGFGARFDRSSRRDLSMEHRDWVVLKLKSVELVFVKEWVCTDLDNIFQFFLFISFCILRLASHFLLQPFNLKNSISLCKCRG